MKKLSALIRKSLCAGLLIAAPANAAVVLSGGGLQLAEEGPVLGPAGTPVPLNLAHIAVGATPFASSDLGPQLGIPFHVAANLNDGLYGNGFSWIGGDANPFPAPFAGISLGAAPVNLASIAFGRSNVNGGDACGVCADRNLGLYTLQYTSAPNPNSATPDAMWTTIGTLDYQPGPAPLFSAPHLRHRYNFDPVNATGIRLLVPATGLGGGTAIDEIELFNVHIAPPPPPPVVVLTPAPGFAIGFNGNQGDFSTPDSPALVPDNRALASNGAVPFTSSDLGPALGIPFHRAHNINDGLYGNSNSWISNFINGDPNPFAGVSFGSVIGITSVAFSRDNGDIPGDCCGGTLTDRAIGTYDFEYTLVASPDASTPFTGDPNTGWADIGTIQYTGNPSDTFLPYLRHEFQMLGPGGSPIFASGLRVRVSDQNMAIDELEVYAIPLPSAAWAGLAMLGVAGLRRRRMVD